MNSVDTMSATADTLRVKVFKTDISSSGCENVPQHAGWTSASTHSDSLAQRLASLGELACLDKNEDSNAPPPRALPYGLRRVGTRRVNSGTQKSIYHQLNEVKAHSINVLLGILRGWPLNT